MSDVKNNSFEVDQHSKVTIFLEKNNKALQHQTTQRMSEGFSCYSNAGDFENYPEKYVKKYMPRCTCQIIYFFNNSTSFQKGLGDRKGFGQK